MRHRRRPAISPGPMGACPAVLHMAHFQKKKKGYDYRLVSLLCKCLSRLLFSLLLGRECQQRQKACLSPTESRPSVFLLFFLPRYAKWTCALVASHQDRKRKTIISHSLPIRRTAPKFVLCFADARIVCASTNKKITEAQPR
nr:hypothetical protein [Pandoravirus massiliensis]